MKTTIITTAVILLSTVIAYAETTFMLSMEGMGKVNCVSELNPVSYMAMDNQVTIMSDPNSEAIAKFYVTAVGLKIGNIVVPSFAVLNENSEVVLVATWSEPIGEAVPTSTTKSSSSTKSKKRVVKSTKKFKIIAPR